MYFVNLKFTKNTVDLLYKWDILFCKDINNGYLILSLPFCWREEERSQNHSVSHNEWLILSVSSGSELSSVYIVVSRMNCYAVSELLFFILINPKKAEARLINIW